MITKRARRLRGINWETDADVYTVLYIKQTTNTNLPYRSGKSLILCNDLHGDGVWKRMDRCTDTADSGFPGGSADKEPACNVDTWVQSLG